jgi:phosphoglycerate dehydrogenase-like enzyme
MKKKAAFALSCLDVAYSSETQRRLRDLFDFEASTSEVEILFTGWGAPRLDEPFLDARPNLEAVFHAAGSVRHMATEDFWRRGIKLSSAWRINARPVAEFSFAQILLALKHTLPRMRRMREERQVPSGFSSPGAYGATVGLVGLGAIGRLTAELLRTIEVRLLAVDPAPPRQLALECGIQLVDIEELFSESDVISLHAPAIASTRHMVHAGLLASMKSGATLINTARGSLIDEMALVQTLQQRPDLTAVLDVTEPEPPESTSPLFKLPNIFLTPHIGGSVGNECWRMGEAMHEEALRHLEGAAFRHGLTREEAETMT